MLGVCGASTVSAQENFLLLVERFNNHIDRLDDLRNTLSGDLVFRIGTLLQRVQDKLLPVNQGKG
jgi:hypothetical protein